MFSRICFRMKNSVGIPVSVNLYNDMGMVEYEILFPELGVDKVKKKRLNRGDSEKFLRRLKKLGLVELIFRFQACGLDSGGDFWNLCIELENGSRVELSGPDLMHSTLYPLIQDFSELLDAQFMITQYVSPSRIDRIDIEFSFNEINPELGSLLPDYDQYCHSEIITLDRASRNLTYTKRFPAECFHSTFECKCENQVRQILDQTSEALTEDRLFEDLVSSSDVPDLTFTFTYHDGDQVQVCRSLSLEGLRDTLYIEMLEVLFETLLHLMFKQGVFDTRFMLPDDKRREAPFFVLYTEGEDDSFFRDLAKNCS